VLEFLDLLKFENCKKEKISSLEMKKLEPAMHMEGL